LKLGLLNRQRRPWFYDLDAHGVYDARERCHWDGTYAAALGHPHAYDYSHTRLAWMAHVLTDWMGDGGWLAGIRFRQLANNYVGDTQWISGTVTSVSPSDDARHGVVAVALRATNQLGTTTCVADAELLRPNRPHHHVSFPASPPRSG
jgi:acyl dehydratase